MMSDKMALRFAIEFMHVPSQVRLFRSEPLPDGVAMLLRIAAGDDEAERAAAALTDRSRDIVRRAAVFFIEQILFAPDADSYQVLGASPTATASELRRNVALLLRWLHPDLDPHGERSIYVSRVTSAWNNLKTPERRADYDRLQRSLNERSRSRATIGKGISGRSKIRNHLAKNLPRPIKRGRGALRTYPVEKLGFFRRAWLIIFQRPLQ